MEISAAPPALLRWESFCNNFVRWRTKLIFTKHHSKRLETKALNFVRSRTKLISTKQGVSKGVIQTVSPSVGIGGFCR